MKRCETPDIQVEIIHVADVIAASNCDTVTPDDVLP